MVTFIPQRELICSTTVKFISFYILTTISINNQNLLRFVKFWRMEKTNVQLPTTFYVTDMKSGFNIKHDQKNPVKCWWHTYSKIHVYFDISTLYWNRSMMYIQYAFNSLYCSRFYFFHNWKISCIMVCNCYLFYGTDR